MVAFEIARRHQFGEELAGLAEAVEVNVLPSGSAPPSLSMRYRCTSGVRGRIDAAHAATAAYLDAKPLRSGARCTMPALSFAPGSPASPAAWTWRCWSSRQPSSPSGRSWAPWSPR